jgi:hypothetical protein
VASLGYGTKGDFFDARYANLSRDDDTNRRPQHIRDGARDRHSAAREPEHDHALLGSVATE